MAPEREAVKSMPYVPFLKSTISGWWRYGASEATLESATPSAATLAREVTRTSQPESRLFRKRSRATSVKRDFSPAVASAPPVRSFCFFQLFYFSVENWF